MKLLIALIVAAATAAGGLFGISKYGENEMRNAGNDSYVARAGEASPAEPAAFSAQSQRTQGNQRVRDSETKPEQEAYFPLCSPDAVRWGRNMSGLAEAARLRVNGKTQADLGYCEYQMRPNGTFRYHGVAYAQKVISEGSYQLRDNSLKIQHLRVIESKYGQEMLRYLPNETYDLQRNSTTGRRMFVSGIHTYLEDFYWDKVGYRDSSGKRFQSPGLNKEKASSNNWMDEACARNLSEARRFYTSLTEEQMKGDLWTEIPNRLLGCPAHKEAYVFNSKNRTVQCPKASR